MKHDDIFEKKHKKRNFKTTFIVILIALLIVAAIVFWPSAENQNSTDEVNEAQNNENVEEVKVYDEVILEETIEFNEFPFKITQELESKTNYEVYFRTDKEIQFVVYSEDRYNEWQETGYHTISKASTKLGSECCDTSRTFKVGINENEGGNYYFVFDDSKLPDKENLPTEGKLVITKKTDI